MRALAVCTTSLSIPPLCCDYCFVFSCLSPGCADWQCLIGFAALRRGEESAIRHRLKQTEVKQVVSDEGVSLHSLMYTAQEGDGFQIVQPSSWWHELRQSKQNMEFERRLIYQLLKAVRLLHWHNDTHRYSSIVASNRQHHAITSETSSTRMC